MTIFLRSNKKTNTALYITFLIIGLILFIILAIIPSVDPIFRGLLLTVIGINAISDIVYIYRERQFVKKVTFAENQLLITLRNGTIKKVAYTDLKYSIRKNEFHKSGTEMELKDSGSTFARLHIKNWEEIFEIEQKFIDLDIKETVWKPRSLWRRYGEGILVLIEILGGILEWISVFA